MQKNSRYLVLVVGIAFLLRVIPYLLGYPYPLTNDAMRDFQQVQFLEKNYQINWGHPYGRFPALHLVVYEIAAMSSIPAWWVNLFIPQLVSSLGILFFYLFLIKKFEEKYALVASLFLATFGPNVWWGVQGVRETVGLFLFPFAVYAFDLVTEKLDFSRVVVFGLAGFTIFFTHNWTALMLFVLLLILSLTIYGTFLKRSVTITFAYSSLMFLNWVLRFPKVIGDSISKTGMVLSILPAGVVLLILLILIYCKKEGIIRKVKSSKKKITKLKLIQLKLLVLFVILFFVLYEVMKKSVVFIYPPQEYLSIFLLGLFSVLGILPLMMKRMRFVAATLIFDLFFVLSVIFGLKAGIDPNFDPMRILEYVVYANAVIAAFGFIFIIDFFKENKLVCGGLCVVLVLGGMLIYPPVFIVGKQVPADSIFFDIRSYIRYLPPEAIDTMGWGYTNNYKILSNNPNYNDLRDTIYPVDGKKAFLVSQYDYVVSDSMGKVNIGSLGVGSPEKIIEASKKSRVLYANGWGTVYEWNENLTESDVLGDYVAGLFM